MDLFTAFGVVPLKDLITQQRKLGLGAPQIWFACAWVVSGASTATELSDVTGVPRETCRDIKRSLEEAGLFSEEDGLAPLWQVVGHLRSGGGGRSDNEPFSGLSAHERVLVADQFMCRVCFSPWKSNGAGGKFRLRKVGDGSGTEESRCVVCERCEPELANPEVVKRLRLYLGLRMPGFSDRDGTVLSDLEQERLLRVRSRGNPSRVESSLVGPSAYARIPTRAEKQLAGEEPLVEAGSTESLLPPSGTEETGPAESAGPDTLDDSPGSGMGPAPEIRRGRGVASDSEEELEAMEPTDRPPPPPRAKAVKAEKAAEDRRRRREQRLERLKGLPDDEWSTEDLALYWYSKYSEKYRMALVKEGVAERRTKASDILEIVGKAQDFRDFCEFVMRRWETFWFGAAGDRWPTIRDAVAHMPELMSAWRGSDATARAKETNPAASRMPEKPAPDNMVLGPVEEDFVAKFER